MPETGRIYSFGSGSCGQLGLGNTDKKTSPFAVPCSFIPWSGTKSSAMDLDGVTHMVNRIYSGGNKCIVLADKVATEVIQ